jgi:hypothetical protein
MPFAKGKINTEIDTLDCLQHKADTKTTTGKKVIRILDG